MVEKAVRETNTMFGNGRAVCNSESWDVSDYFWLLAVLYLQHRLIFGRGKLHQPGIPNGRQFPQQSVDHLLIVHIAQADAK